MYVINDLTGIKIKTPYRNTSQLMEYNFLSIIKSLKISTRKQVKYFSYEVSLI